MLIEVELLIRYDREEIAKVQVGDSAELENSGNLVSIFGRIGNSFFVCGREN